MTKVCSQEDSCYSYSANGGYLIIFNTILLVPRQVFSVKQINNFLLQAPRLPLRVLCLKSTKFHLNVSHCQIGKEKLKCIQSKGENCPTQMERDKICFHMAFLNIFKTYNSFCSHSSVTGLPENGCKAILLANFLLYSHPFFYCFAIS
ncbi:hypothetical protein OS493_013525 [Desmophyllum pertusum]|uniref:Uncharacterized protein n=1 Tax=Desmophyllum pertusum TaxID=174260 RepID=A0A9X0A344_9CNID|nr:hypothetical protein OS493_013525 [Desmophyllum pertusum]